MLTWVLQAAKFFSNVYLRVVMEKVTIARASNLFPVAFGLTSSMAADWFTFVCFWMMARSVLSCSFWGRLQKCLSVPSPMELILWILTVLSTSLYLASCSLVLRSPILCAALSIQFSTSMRLLVFVSISFWAVMDSLAREKTELLVEAVLRE